MKLSPIPWLTEIGKSMFKFLPSEDEEALAQKRAEDILRHEKTLSDANELETMSRTPGYALLREMIEERRDTLREQLEKGGNVTILRARLEELKQILSLVPTGIERAGDARKALVELERQ